MLINFRRENVYHHVDIVKDKIYEVDYYKFIHVNTYTKEIYDSISTIYDSKKFKYDNFVILSDNEYYSMCEELHDYGYEWGLPF